MIESTESIAIVQNYFKAFQQGNLKEVLNKFHDDCLIISVRDEIRNNEQLHGTYRTKTQAKQFLKNISDLFITIEFIVEEVIGNRNLVFANGKFIHKLKATGKKFTSDWAQRCIIEDGKIKEYQFYEDSAAFEEASKK
jgi:ketosteroid isomerase-like protein